MIFPRGLTPPHWPCHIGEANPWRWVHDPGLTIQRCASFWTQRLVQGWTCDPSSAKDSPTHDIFWNYWERGSFILSHLMSWWHLGWVCPGLLHQELLPETDVSAEEGRGKKWGHAPQNIV